MLREAGKEGTVPQPTWMMLLAFLFMVVPAAFALTATARMFYHHVNTAHPVYAVLMQEVVVLAALSWATSASLLLSSLLPAAKMAANTLPIVSIRVHQVSWLVVTALR